MKFGTDILQIMSFEENVLDILNLKNGGEIQDVVILVSTMWFSGTPDIVVWQERTLGHYIVGEIQNGRHMFKVKQ